MTKNTQRIKIEICHPNFISDDISQFNLLKLGNIMAMDMKQVIDIADTFGGANFWYGCRMRPPGLGCHPKNTSALISNNLALSHFGDIKDKTNVRHGAIAYPIALTAQEINNFELVDLNNVDPIDMSKYSLDIMNGALNIMLTWTTGSLENPRDVRNLLSEIEDDGAYLLRQAYKEMSQFTHRKNSPEEFAHFRKVIAIITPDVFAVHVKDKVKHLKVT